MLTTEEFQLQEDQKREEIDEYCDDDEEERCEQEEEEGKRELKNEEGAKQEAAGFSLATNGEKRGILEEVLYSIFEVGVNNRVQMVIHSSFLLLMACLGFLLYLSRSWHVAALITIATMLWLTLTWFMSQLNEEEMNSILNVQGSDGHLVKDERPLNIITPKGKQESKQESKMKEQNVSSSKTPKRSKKLD